jgi:hypothetical protein
MSTEPGIVRPAIHQKDSLPMERCRARSALTATTRMTAGTKDARWLSSKQATGLPPARTKTP